jgi:hypothetical protein
MKSSLLSKAGAVLEAVCTIDHPVAIKELTQILGMPLPTVSRLCADLVEIGLLEKTDYHHLIPGISLIRFGHRAKKLSPLINTVKKFVDNYSDESGLNAAIYGFDKGSFFHIYSCHQNNPSHDALRYTGAFLVMLTTAGFSSEKAQATVLKKYPDMSVTERVICDREYDLLRQNKPLTRISPHRKWAITMPFVYNGIPCSLSFYGQGREDRTFEAELFNESKVLSKIRSAIDRMGKGED